MTKTIHCLLIQSIDLAITFFEEFSFFSFILIEGVKGYQYAVERSMLNA